MPAPKEQKHSFASILLVLVIFGSLAALVFIPTQIFEKVRAAEQLSIQRWLGDETDQWIMMQIFDLLQSANQEAKQSIGEVAVTSNGKIDGWLMQRVYAGLVWVHVILYRCGVFVMWGAFGIPVVMALLIDGHYQRQISKATFSSQSPVLHKSGIDILKGSVAVLVAWIFVPWHITMLIAPLCILMTGVAGWIWIANAPKRI